MNNSNNKSILKIFLDESDKLGGAALYEKILLKSRELDLMGATVLRGIAGYGVHKQIHTSKILVLGSNLPIIIEVIDDSENLDKLINYLKEIRFHGIVTREKIEIIAL